MVSDRESLTPTAEPAVVVTTYPLPHNAALTSDSNRTDRVSPDDAI